MHRLKKFLDGEKTKINLGIDFIRQGIDSILTNEAYSSINE